ncbi:MAG: hypothetical protein ABSB09_07920 [Acidimicrobiales bacterium]
MRISSTKIKTGAVTHMALAVVQEAPALTTIEARFSGPIGFEDYPTEIARITALRDGTMLTVPVGDPRRMWYHRNPPWSAAKIISAVSSYPPLNWPLATGTLCLEYPGDPPRLRWDWSQGLDTYLQIVHRHLMAEEFRRRYGSWPVEDVPHGERSDGSPHPIMTATFEAA